VQIKAEFINGFAEQGQVHLLQVANDWQKHPGNIIEWHSSTDSRHEGSHYYSAAAGTMGSAIIEGFFGIELDGHGLTLQPRLGLNDGFIRVYQPATDRYAAYSYDWNQNTTRIDYGTNAADPVRVKVLKLRSEHISAVTVDGQSVEFEAETVGQDTYTVFAAPSGQHSIELSKGQPLVQPAAVEVEASPALANETTTAPEPTASASVTSNLAPPPETATIPEPAGVEQSLEPEPAPTVEVASATILPDDQAQEAKPAAPASGGANEKNRQNRYAFFRFIGISLVILTSLLLMILVALRRAVGLG
jgi:hypothetical protein